MAHGAVTTVPIARISPEIDPGQNRVFGVVTLIWPYSSTDKRLSLLLVEPDFRLRAQRGQVRVFFTGASAKALSKAGIESGDHLSLKLNGVTYGKDHANISTPGRSIEWNLQFGQYVDVEVRRY